MIAVQEPPGSGLLAERFATDFAEDAYEVTRVEGRIPEYIRGTYYVNGPARFARGEQVYRNWLDGDGMVCAVRFDGGVQFINRYVGTRKFTAEEEAGRLIFRTFGTSFPGDRLRRGIVMESPANVSVSSFAGRLLAFGEQSLPYAIDPDTLETQGVYDFGGALTEISPFSAHPKRDPATGELMNLGVSFSSRDPRLNYYRFDARANLIRRTSVPLDAPYSIHDFSASRNHVVVHLSPYVLDIECLLHGSTPMVDALRWLPERGSRLLILARDDGRELARPVVDPGYSLHTIRSFEDGDSLIVDLIEYDRPLYPAYQPLPELFDDVLCGRPVRYEIDTRTWQVKHRSPLAYGDAPDFPCVHPCEAAHGDVWMLGISAARRRGPKFFDRLVRVSWRDRSSADIYAPPSGRYLAGEPAVVPHPSDPFLASVICHEFDPRTSASWFVIFDAYELGRGPTARLGLEQPIPPGFHSTFCAREGARYGADLR
jgi:all-trans-8'-apo-beta-carotenal 15,15'-oxygenase